MVFFKADFSAQAWSYQLTNSKTPMLENIWLSFMCLLIDKFDAQRVSIFGDQFKAMSQFSTKRKKLIFKWNSTIKLLEPIVAPKRCIFIEKLLRPIRNL